MAGSCANITDARLNALCNLARAHFGAAQAAGVNPTTVVVSSSFTTQSVETVFAVLSWLVFGLLLAGRWRYGWRGRTALRWTLTGFVMLLLAYVGSRFVLEVLLGRS